MYSKQGIYHQRQRNHTHDRTKFGQLIEIGNKGCCKEQDYKAPQAYQEIDRKSSSVVLVRDLFFTYKSIRKTTVHKNLGNAEKNRQHSNHSEVRWTQQARKNNANKELDSLQGESFNCTPDNALY